MPTDEKRPITDEEKAIVKDAVDAANAAAIEVARAKKRTADAEKEAVNGSMVYVARKLMKHAIERCSVDMHDAYGPRIHELACMLKEMDHLVPRIAWDAVADYREAKREESEAALEAVIAANAAAAAVSAANLCLTSTILTVEVFEASSTCWVERIAEPLYDADTYGVGNSYFAGGIKAARADIDTIAAKIMKPY